jgi:hypothetical protein
MRRYVIVLILASFVAGLVIVLERRATTVRDVFPTGGETALSDFHNGGTLNSNSYRMLFAYFIRGFETYHSPGGATALYPGMPSRNGESSDALEGFSRIMSLVAAWVHSGRPSKISAASGDLVDLPTLFQRGLVSGTDPQSAEYWGDIHDLNQRIVEASDVALALWLLRDWVWPKMSASEKSNVIAWLRQVEGKRVPDNNWHLFHVFIDAVLRSFGVATDRATAIKHYVRFKEFYRGDGWFSDGPGEIFDYYNAWSIHYQLYWLQQVDPNWDSAFISETRRQFLEGYRYLIGPAGFPVMGRSICYRMAAPVPLIFGSRTDPKQIPPGEGRRALNATWSYFIQRGAVKGGNVTQGYCGTDPRVIDNYSGPASCLWALRSLVVAFAIPETAEFWTGAPGLLPVEKGDFEVRIGPPHWTVTGHRRTGAIQLQKPGLPKSEVAGLSDYNIIRQAASAILWRPFRPENHRPKYELDLYDSSQPFCGCLAE